jgi:hypothetical protein
LTTAHVAAVRGNMARMRNRPLFIIALLAVAFAPLLIAADKPKDGGKRWSGDGVSWELPEGWKLDDKPAAMRFATILVPAEPKPLQLTVSRFPGDVGGTLANINRWRMQIGLPSVGEADLAKEVKDVETGGGKAGLADMENPQTKQRLIGVILPAGEQTWFFKLTGPSSAVGPHKEKLTTFLKSVKVDGGKKA